MCEQLRFGIWWRKHNRIISSCLSCHSRLALGLVKHLLYEVLAALHDIEQVLRAQRVHTFALLSALDVGLVEVARMCIVLLIPSPVTTEAYNTRLHA